MGSHSVPCIIAVLVVSWQRWNSVKRDALMEAPAWTTIVKSFKKLTGVESGHLEPSILMISLHHVWASWHDNSFIHSFIHKLAQRISNNNTSVIHTSEKYQGSFVMVFGLVSLWKKGVSTTEQCGSLRNEHCDCLVTQTRTAESSERRQITNSNDFNDPATWNHRNR